MNCSEFVLDCLHVSVTLKYNKDAYFGKKRLSFNHIITIMLLLTIHENDIKMTKTSKLRF